MATEEFKDVPGFPTYQVSKSGLIRRAFEGFEPQLLKPSRQLKGNLNLPIIVGDRVKQISVHHLIAITFLPRPPQAKQVRHRNGDKSDNRIENLYWYLPTIQTVKKHLVIQEYDPFVDGKGTYRRVKPIA